MYARPLGLLSSKLISRPGRRLVPRYAPDNAPAIAANVSVSPPRKITLQTAASNDSGVRAKLAIAVGTECSASIRLPSAARSAADSHARRRLDLGPILLGFARREQTGEEAGAIELFHARAKGDRPGQQLRPLDARAGGGGSAAPTAAPAPTAGAVVAKGQPDRSDAHRGPVAERPAREVLLGHLPIIAAVLHRVQHGPGSAAVTPRRDVVGDKGPAQHGLDDLAALDRAPQ